MSSPFLNNATIRPKVRLALGSPPRLDLSATMRFFFFNSINFRKTSSNLLRLANILHAQLPAGLRSWIGYNTTIQRGTITDPLRRVAVTSHTLTLPENEEDYTRYLLLS